MREDEGSDRDLDRVIAAVSGGEPVDWGSETARRPDLVALLEELRVMESVAAAHRGRPAENAKLEIAQWGPLRLVERIGRGGFGDVYRAFDPRLQTEVALKLIRPGSGREAYILKEARRMARVRHANVLTVHGADHHDGRAGLWTDLIEGRTLEDLLTTNGPLGADEAARIGLDLCRALAAVHAAGLVHRDVKTNNVMRERGGRIVLMDFGAGAESGNGVGLAEDGTPFTMAPEELRGEGASPVSDLYSLGVLLYRLVTGRFPVEAHTYAELGALHERGEHVRLRDRRPDLPESFVRVVERALEVRPERRFRSAGGFERALMGEGTESVTPAPPFPRRDGLRRTISWLAVGAALVAVVSVAILRPWERSAEPLAPGARQGGPEQTLAEGDPSDQLPLPGPSSGDANTVQSGQRPDGPRPVDSPQPTVSLVASATMLREREGREQPLGPGDRVAPGDAVFLKFEASDPAHVYVFNEDAAGAMYVLFPAPGTDLRNPLAAGVVHRLPGSSGGRNVSWRVTSQGGRETIVLIAAPRPLATLEREIAHLPRVSLDRPVARAPENGSTSDLRGIGGMVEGAPSEGHGSRGRLARLISALPKGHEAPWIWRIELGSPP